MSRETQQRRIRRILNFPHADRFLDLSSDLRDGSCCGLVPFASSFRGQECAVDARDAAGGLDQYALLGLHPGMLCRTALNESAGRMADEMS